MTLRDLEPIENGGFVYHSAKDASDYNSYQANCEAPRSLDRIVMFETLFLILQDTRPG
jgi:hypothetical protein